MFFAWRMPEGYGGQEGKEEKKICVILNNSGDPKVE